MNSFTQVFLYAYFVLTFPSLLRKMALWTIKKIMQSHEGEAAPPPKESEHE
jgi:hypothetical protein